MLESRIGIPPEQSSAFSTPHGTRSSQEVLTEFLSTPESRELRPTERRELSALCRESDSELFHTGLLHLARRLEVSERAPLATRLYSLVQSQSQDLGLRNRAQSRLALFEGGGDFGDRMEFHASHFFGQATDPTALGAMAVGGAAFRVARLGLLGRLLANPSASWATRGFGARALAGGGAFLAESFAFTSAGRGFQALAGRSQDWSLRALGQEWAAGAITLASLRGFGALGGGLYRRVHGNSASPWHALYGQTAMFGGILAAHAVEERLGLRQPTQGANALLDGFVTLLHFNVAGHLLRQGMGPRWQAWERGLDQRAERLSWNPPQPRNPFAGLGGMQTAPALAGNGAPALRWISPRRTEGFVMMEGKPSGETGPAEGAGESAAPARPPSEPPSPDKPPSWWPAGELTVEMAQAFINAQPDSTVIIEFVRGESSKGLIGQIRMANTRVKEKFGYEPEEAVGMPLSRFTRPEDSALMARMQRMILDTGRIKFNEVRFVRKDGTVIYCDVRGTTHRLGNRTIGFATLQDVSKRRAAQAAIRAEQMRFRALLRGVPDVIFRIGHDGTFLDAHSERAEIFPLPMDKVVGMKVWDLPVPPELLDLARNGIEAALSTGQTQYVEYRLPMPDGTFRIQEGRITASGADEVVATVRDITEARQAETHRIAAARAETLKLIGRGLAHDANNALAPLDLGLKLLLRQMRQSEESGVVPTIEQVQIWNNSIETILSSAERLKNMIGGFRELSQDPAQGPPFDLHSLLDAAELRNTVGTNVHLRVRLSAEPWLIPGPRENIHRVILNLVVNANDAMEGRNGSLRIETDRVVLSVEDLRQLTSFSPGILHWRGGNFMRVRVQDNGPGIPPEHMSRIFEPYFSTKTKDGKSGHGGLGLALTQKLVQDAGGFLTVETSPNGTTFDVYLPQADRISSRPPAVVSPALSQARGKAILIVSPDQAFRETIGVSLTNRGFSQVLYAQNLAEAQALARSSGELGALLTESRFPDEGQGFDLMKDLRRQQPQLATIIWSGLDPSRYADRLGPSGTFLSRDTSSEIMGGVLEDLMTRSHPSP
ncbi:MAG TPA: PAS domain S-box protein [bacterium]|nr:PAS domain S-box protein [bacterium]